MSENKDNLKLALHYIHYVCTTTDIWSCKNRSSLDVTCHWIDDKLLRKLAPLACRGFSEAHTHDHTAELLEDIHTAYNLQPNNY